jgi:hypothetical protein
MYHTRRTWHRFNAAQDRFEEAAPFDEFQFNAGGRTLSIVGWHDDTDSWDSGKVYQLKDDRWLPMAYPFVAANDSARGESFGQAPVFAVPGRSLHNGRMLLSSFGGVFEWDLQANRYAYLAPLGDCWAIFDGERRLLVSDDAILMYEGEPFAAQAPSRPNDELEATVTALLKSMDSNSWRERDNATNGAISLIRKNPIAVSAILERPSLAKSYSSEVRSRVELVLMERPGSIRGSSSGDGDRAALERLLGNSLFERVHPSRTPKIRYVIEPGMEYEHAEAVFVAAGGQYSSEIHNANYHRPSTLARRGYLLVDNTMVYLSVERKDDKGKIVSVGLGETGKGNNPDWDWGDLKRNSVKSLELKPDTGRGR